MLGNHEFFATSHFEKKLVKNCWDFKNICKMSMLQYRNKFGLHYFNCNTETIPSHSTLNTINTATSSEIHLYSLRIYSHSCFRAIIIFNTSSKTVTESELTSCPKQTAVIKGVPLAEHINYLCLLTVQTNTHFTANL